MIVRNLDAHTKNVALPDATCYCKTVARISTRFPLASRDCPLLFLTVTAFGTVNQLCIDSTCVVDIAQF
jgi:hypothetical protein